MNAKTVNINGQHVSFDDLIKFINSQKKLQAIKFIKTSFKIDLRDAKAAVEYIQAGEPNRAFQILNPHNECSDPILERNSPVDNSHDTQRNPFLIKENKLGNRSKYILIIGLAMLLLALAMVYFSSKPVGQ